MVDPTILAHTILYSGAQNCSGPATLSVLNVIVLIFDIVVHAGALIAIFYFIKDKLFGKKCKCEGECMCGKRQRTTHASTEAESE